MEEPGNEIERKYRLTKQMIAMHFSLAESSKLKARIAETILLAASVIFAATTFASDFLYTQLGLDPNTMRLWLGLAAVLACVSSAILLLRDWPGEAASHQFAGRRLSEILGEFRMSRSDDGAWSEDDAKHLGERYDRLNDSLETIPDRQFNSLKAAYLYKKNVSAMASEHPGVPLFLVALKVRLRAMRGLW